ncbi:MAG: hypothetical protein NC485_10980 [Ruminococcus flavefaciens]|nr:hypothetical protein [Ruminococcus flavefaciens]MCM1060973.1 hypothetical protein [Eubacterium sp.]
MKKVVYICTLILILISLAACSNEDSDSMNRNDLSAEFIHNSEETRSESSALVQNQTDTLSSEIIQSTDADIEDQESKILIAYFSLNEIVPEDADASTHATPSIGNTETAALKIQELVGGDLFAIKTVRTYPVDHRECSAVAEEEMRSDARPELSSHLESMDDYDVVYIGYPIWWYIEPMAIRTFLEEYDFSGKTIIPFCTTMGAGIDESENNISSLAESTVVLKGVTLRTGQQDMTDDISSWLSDIGMTD